MSAMKSAEAATDLVERVRERVLVRGEYWIRMRDAAKVVEATIESGADVATDWQVVAESWRVRFWFVFILLGAATGWIIGR